MRCLARGNAKELGVEQIDAFEKSAPARIRSAGLFWIRIEQVPESRPARRRFRDGVESLFQQAPECLRIVRTAGEPASNSHNRDIPIEIPRCAISYL